LIEDKDFKMAESPEEALWERVRKTCETEIKTLKESLEVQKVFLKAAEDKLIGIPKK
jgi:hypothetical protein